MTHFMDLIKKRRSTRCFEKNLKIKTSELELCTEAGRLAPSACNSQPWKFIIINNSETLNLVKTKTISGIYQMNTFAKEASAFIAICSESIKLAAWIGGKIKGTDYRSIDIGITCENIVLQAEELGIASCILGWFNERQLKKILNVPFGKNIELLIALGYPKKKEYPKKIRKNKTEIISFNKY